MAKKHKRQAIPASTPAAEQAEHKLAVELAKLDQEPTTVEATPVEATPVEATAPAKRPPGKLRVAYNRQSAFPGSAVITAIPGKNGANPKKAGSKSFTRFALYVPGQTVDEYVAAVVAHAAAGCTSLNARADVRWDWVHGFIEVDGQTVGQS